MTTKHGRTEVKLHEFSTEHAKVARDIVDSDYTAAKRYSPDYATRAPGGYNILPTEDMRVDPVGSVFTTHDGKGVWVPVHVFVPWEAIEREIKRLDGIPPERAQSGAEGATGIEGATLDIQRPPSKFNRYGMPNKDWTKVEASKEKDYGSWQAAVAVAATALGFHEWVKFWGTTNKGWDKVETSNEDTYARWQAAVASGETELGFPGWVRHWRKS